MFRGRICVGSFVGFLLFSFFSFEVFGLSLPFSLSLVFQTLLSDINSVSVSLELRCCFANKQTTRLRNLVRFRTVFFRGGLGSLVLLGFCRSGWAAFGRYRVSAFH